MNGIEKCSYRRVSRCPHVFLCKLDLLDDHRVYEKIEPCAACILANNDSALTNGKAQQQLTNGDLVVSAGVAAAAHADSQEIGNSAVVQWLCAFNDCGFCGCANHATDHFDRQCHPIGRNLATNQLRCFQCGIDLVLNSPDFRGLSADQSRQAINDYRMLWPPLIYERYLSKRQIVPGLVGLLNSSSTCFANAVMQCLSNCSSMTLNLLSEPKPSTPLLSVYRNVIERLWLDTNMGSFPVSIHLLCDQIFRKSMNFQFDAQHDAQEFLRCLLDHIWHWSAPGGAKVLIFVLNSEMGQTSAGRTLIQRLFSGSIRSSVKCLRCHNTSQVIEQFQDLSLPVLTYTERNALQTDSDKIDSHLLPSENTEIANQQRSALTVGFEWLYILLAWIRPIFEFIISYSGTSRFISSSKTSLCDLVEAYMRPEVLDGENMYRCDKCQTLTNGLRESKFVELPEILSIHLKRFRHEDINLPRKLHNHIAFGHELDLSEFVCTRQCRQKIFRYDLFGIICHEGNPNGGHYLSYCKNFMDGEWYEFNDTRVNWVSSHTVLSRQAYLLFYQKQFVCPASERYDRLIRQFETGRQADSSLARLLSRQYLNEYFLASEDSQSIYNATAGEHHIICEHGLVQPRQWENFPEMTVCVPEKLIRSLFNEKLSMPKDILPCTQCLRNERDIVRKSRNEYFTFKKLMQFTFNCSTEAISIVWFNVWEKYVSDALNQPRPSGPPSSAPPAIQITTTAFNFLKSAYSA